jgi:hypothetical protein
VTEELRRRFGKRSPTVHEIRYALEAICADFRVPPGVIIEVVDKDPQPHVYIVVADRSDELLVEALQSGLDRFMQELFRPF